MVEISGERKPMRKNRKPKLVVAPPVFAPVPSRVIFQHGDTKFYVCPRALGRALNCGQRVPLYADPVCPDPVQVMPGALIQVAALAA